MGARLYLFSESRIFFAQVISFIAVIVCFLFWILFALLSFMSIVFCLVNACVFIFGTGVELGLFAMTFISRLLCSLFSIVPPDVRVVGGTAFVFVFQLAFCGFSAIQPGSFVCVQYCLSASWATSVALRCVASMSLLYCCCLFSFVFGFLGLYPFGTFTFSSLLELPCKSCCRLSLFGALRFSMPIVSLLSLSIWWVLGSYFVVFFPVSRLA
ncbi:hypothetical protein SK79_01221 [Escherichia coli]|nr:hypothetical protein SK79_01221 [Escherichia coli]